MGNRTPLRAEEDAADTARSGQNASEFVTIIDRDFKIRSINQVPPGVTDVVGTSVFDQVDPRFHDTLRGAIAQAVETGRPWHFESSAKGSEGKRSTYSNWVTALASTEEAGLVSVVGIDISHLRRVEAELEDSRETLASLVNDAPDYIMLVDRDHRVVFVNRLEMGFVEGDVLGASIEQFVPENDRPIVSEAIDYVFETGGHTGYRLFIDAPAGRRWFATRLGPVRHNGEVVRVTLISTDITEQMHNDHERVRLASELEQARRMEALGQLTGGIAHDFNNVLAAISGNVELMSQLAGDPSAVRECAEAALESVQRASSLTTRLLAFARRQPLVSRPTDPNRVIDGLRELLDRSLGGAVPLRTELEPGVWCCCVDPAQLENAILNLALNSRDAMPNGGTVSIETGNRQISESCALRSGSLEPGEYVWISVTDQGVGIDTHMLDRIFEPFFTTKREGKGSGLGLSMVYGFVQQSSGQLDVESVPNAGTTFSIYLPRDTRPERSTEDDGASATHRGSGELVLVVEDEEAVRRLTTELLRTLGYRTIEASDSAEALARLEEWPDVQLLLSDVLLPGRFDGVQLAAMVVEMHPRMRVLFMSGYSDRALDGSSVADADLLAKPFTRLQLAASVGRAIGRV